jgi:hypothetical protein
MVLQINENHSVFYVFRSIYKVLSIERSFMLHKGGTRQMRKNFVNKGSFIFTGESLLISRKHVNNMKFELGLRFI